MTTWAPSTSGRPDALCPFCDATDETWNRLPAWPGFGFSTAAGRIRSPAGRILAQRPSNRPREAPPERRYRLVNLCLGGTKTTVTVHSMILMANGDGTYPPGARPAGMEVSHKDDNPAHNCATNLCWEDHPTNEGRKPPGQHAAAARIRNAPSNNGPGTRPVTAGTPVTRRHLRKQGDRARAPAHVGDGMSPVGTPVTGLRGMLRRVMRRKGTSAP